MDKNSSSFAKNPYQGVAKTGRVKEPVKGKSVDYGKYTKLDNSAPRVTHTYDTNRAKNESRGMGKTGFGGSV